MMARADAKAKLASRLSPEKVERLKAILVKLRDLARDVKAAGCTPLAPAYTARLAIHAQRKGARSPQKTIREQP